MKSLISALKTPFQKDHSSWSQGISPAILNTKLSPHFTLGELVFSETAMRKGINNIPPARLLPNLKRLCNEVLEPVRKEFNTPFSPTSGYRSQSLNKAIGGSTRSQHCLGMAVDIKIPGVSNYEIAEWLRLSVRFDQLILECYKKGVPYSGWVHVSMSPQEPRGMVLTYSNRRYSTGLNA